MMKFTVLGADLVGAGRRTRCDHVLPLVASLLLGAATAQAQNYIPAQAKLVNESGDQVCAIGSSKRSDSAPPYYLTSNGQGLGVWREVTAATPSVSGLQVGSDIKTIDISPSASQPYINSALIRFYVISPSAGVQCSSLSFKFVKSDSGKPTGDIEVAYYPYPNALFEMTAWASGGANVLTLDTSNVDSFQAPLAMTVSNGSKTLAELGNPTGATPATRETMITGPNGSGGQQSPFVAWLVNQNEYTGDSKLFQPLALSSAANSPERYPYALIESPKDYLSARCMPNGSTFIPSNCKTANATLHALDPLNRFFDQALATFFQDAYADKNAPLVVMGDASGPIQQGAWTATGNTANCPIYMKPDGHSLALQMSGNTVVICNPAGQMVTMAGEPGSYDAQTGQLQISAQQYDLYKDGKYIGWNLDQPDSGFVGKVDAITAQGGTYFIKLTATGAPNPAYKGWVFTNLKTGLGVNISESASEMVFANDGAFAAWTPTYESNSNLKTVALSIERNIVQAFSHGIANCNNVTMARSKPPSYCGNIKKSGTIVPAAANASDAYWMNEANWYPANSPHDYYAQYLHTAQIAANGGIVAGTKCPAVPCSNIFLVPNNSIGNEVAGSNQGNPMGMAYGFGYDENPVYVSNPVLVPSKLDPIPTSWGTGLSLSVTIGRSR